MLVGLCRVSPLLFDVVHALLEVDPIHQEDRIGIEGQRALQPGPDLDDVLAGHAGIDHFDRPVAAGGEKLPDQIGIGVLVPIGPTERRRVSEEEQPHDTRRLLGPQPGSPEAVGVDGVERVVHQHHGRHLAQTPVKPVHGVHHGEEDQDHDSGHGELRASIRDAGQRSAHGREAVGQLTEAEAKEDGRHQDERHEPEGQREQDEGQADATRFSSPQPVARAGEVEEQGE